MAAVQTKVDSLGDEVRHISEALRAYMQEGITGSDRRKLRTPIPKAGRDCLQHLLSRIDQVAAGLAEIGKLASHTSPPPPPARGPDTPLSYHSPRSQAALPVASSPGAWSRGNVRSQNKAANNTGHSPFPETSRIQQQEKSLSCSLGGPARMGSPANHKNRFTSHTMFRSTTGGFLPPPVRTRDPPALAAETATSVPDPPSATRQRLQVQQCRPQTPPTPPDQHPESRAPQSAENATQQTCKSPARAEITLSDGSVYVPPVAQEQAAPLFDCRYADINVLREELFEMYSSHPDVQNRGYFKLQVRELPPLRVRTVESPGKDHATSFTYKADHLGLVKVDTGKKMRFKAPTLPFPTSEQTVWSLEQQRELWNASAADPPKGTRGYIIGNPLFQDVELSPGEKLKRRGRAVLEGINTQYVYFNLTGKTITTMHREDAHVRSENLLRSGEHKFWCFVKPAFSKKLEERMATEYPEMRRCSQAVRHLSRHIPPAKLDEWGIEYTLDYCVPGQAVVTEPGTYHQVLNLGPNYALAVNVEYMSSPDDPPDYRFCDKQCPDKHAMSADDFRLSDTRHNLAGQERERAMMMRSSASQAAPDQGRTEAIRSSMAQSAPKKRGRPPKTRPAPERPVSSQPGLAAPPVTQSATPAPEQRTPSARSQPNGESARPFHVQPQPQRNPFQRPEGPGQDAVPIPRMSSATSGSHLPYHHPSRQPLQSPLRPPIGFELPIPPAPPSFPTRAAAAAGAASEVPVLMSPFPPVHHLSRLQHPHMPPAELPRSHVGPDPSPDAVRGTQRVSDVAHYTEHHIPGPPPDAPDEETMRRRSPIRKTARLVRPKRRAPREAPSPGPPKKRRVLECPPPPAPAPLSPLHCDVSALLRSCHAAQAATRFEIPPPEQVSGKPAFERLTRLVQEWRRTSHGPDPMPWGMQLLAYWEASAESDSELPSFLARFCKWKIAERLTQLQQGELERGGREDAQKPVAASADDSFRSHKDQLLQELGWENTPYNQTKLDEYVREGKCWGTLCGSFDGLLCFVPSGASYWELAVFQDRVHLFHSQLESEFVRKMCDVGRMFQNAVWDNLELPEFVFESVDTAKLDTTQILPTLQQYKTIKENVYHMHNAYFWPRPSFWPHIWYWPVDPTAVPPNKRHCDTCKKKSACRCHERDIPDVPRVVVHGDRDLGVRTVGVYTEGAILGELVGELVPAGILPNEWTLEVRRPDSPLLGAVVAEIHTKEMGNWVRFVKHSPNPNCEFAVKKLSGRYRVLLVASRYILPGEEITAKYGRGYRKENPYSVMEGI
ncbi:hypothetical protein QBC35DRAFT_514199 [Podospora australis]|uniref:Uncharacterized protein n=1 Tax=Podospora australis TaxID=1536484 RepID=A0AAN6WZ75_9PEZI|nr:hypothetical protein QBC35DRAFT_514199 [Podospora australis]